MKLFDTPADYRAFLEVFGEAQHRVPVRCLSYCVMPNHFHFVLWPQEDGDMSKFMFWLTTTHSMRWNAWHGTSGIGHVYQGRYKALPVQQDTHFLRVCRYVERNALRAALVTRAEEWRWSSLAQRCGSRHPIKLADWPVPRPDDWVDSIQPDPSGETQEIRQAVRRGTPYGPEEWQGRTAARLGLSKSLRAKGRPWTITEPNG